MHVLPTTEMKSFSRVAVVIHRSMRNSALGWGTLFRFCPFKRDMTFRPEDPPPHPRQNLYPCVLSSTLRWQFSFRKPLLRIGLEHCIADEAAQGSLFRLYEASNGTSFLFAELLQGRKKEGHVAGYPEGLQKCAQF